MGGRLPCAGPTPGHFMMRIRMPNGDRHRGAGAPARARSRGSRGATSPTSPRASRSSSAGSTIEGVPEVMARLEAAGLSSLQTGMDNIRGIIGCPATGLTPQRALRHGADRARASSGSSSATRRSPTCRASSTSPSPAASSTAPAGETQDISMTPALRRALDGEVAGLQPGRRRQAGIGRARRSPRRSTPSSVPDEAAEVCAAIALIFRDHGPREARSKSRLAFLIERVGRPSASARSSRRGWSGRCRPPAAMRAAEAPRDHIGVFRQRQPGLNYVGLKTPVGRVTGDQLLELARLSESYGQGELRFTPLAERAHPARSRRAARRPDPGAAARASCPTTRPRSSAGSSRARARTSATSP